MAESKTFHVKGMHCASCEFLIEDALQHVDGVTSVKADLGTNTVTVDGDLPQDASVFAQKLTSLVAAQGYAITTDSAAQSAHREYIVAIPAAIAFIAAFVLLQRIGLVNLISGGEVTYGTAFVVGLVASVSTCLAVVGGLVLSISASAAKEHGTLRSQMLFHVGRLGGFFVLGGVIGVLGKMFQFGFVGTAVLSILVAVVMFILGVNLLDTFPRFKKFQLRLPKLFARHATRVGNSSHGLAPLLAGVATFFLPCGFTQSMQFYSLTTGNYLQAGLTMLFFALGTFPVLALLSFGALEIAHKPWKGTFFKVTGLVVIALAVFNMLNGLVSLGLIPPLFTL